MNCLHLARSLVLAGLVLATAAAQSYTFTRFAGVLPTQGSADGTGTNARFNAPTAVAIDASGNLYVADTLNYTVRKVTAAGVVTTLAGAPGLPGATDGTGSNARLGTIYALAVDGSGTVWVTEEDNHTIRKISPAGVVTTFAGEAGVKGSNDATGTSAHFSSPVGIAVDRDGSLYVADRGNRVVRKITAAGVTSTLAGAVGLGGNTDGAGSVARFNALSGLCLAASGNLYVTDSSSCLVRKITPAGVVSTLAGTGSVGSANGFGQTASFDLPNGISVDSAGNLYVADTRNETIRKIAADGTVTLFAGTVGLSGNTNATGSSARFFRPYSTAVDAAGNVYVADANNQSIRKITSAGVTSTLAGGGGNVGQQDGVASVARFYVPYSLAMDSTGSLYVADSLNSALRKISPAGEVTTIAGSFGQVGSTDGPLDVAEFGVPVGVAVDATGHVFVSDALYNTVRRVADGEVRTHAGVASLTGGAANGAAGVSRFLTPQGMAFDRDGNLYVADTGNHTIRKISPGGTTSTFAGLSGAPGAADGTGTDAQFDNPSGVAVDGAGNVFVADTGNQLIRKISPAGAVVTLAGLAGVTGNSDGTGGNARFYDPYGVAVDAEGNVFVADTDNSAVRRISPAGVVTTIGGGSYSGLFAEGSGASAHLYSPIGIVVTPTGELFLSDSLSNVIVKAVRESAPVITVQPQALTVTPGTRVNLSVTATGGGISYQWYFNHSPISGATGSSYVVANAQSAQAGTYSVSVSNSTGALVSSAAPLTVATSSDPGRLINLSILTPLSAGEIMTMGTALGGAGTSGGKALIARAVGPSLGAFGVTGVLPDPQLSMVSLSTGATIATNNNWDGDAALGVAFSQVGAFPLPADSTDAGVLQSSLSPGNYTVQISDHTGATGTVIAELYDATPSNAFSLTTPRLVNVSVLKKISAGATLTAGFIVGGATAKTVIVRAVGPTLGFAPFNIPGVMADPKLELFNNATGLKLTENDDWNGDATLVSASAAVGAFSLASGATKDAVLLYTLPPGQYSARVSAADGAGGTMIVEVYEVP